MKKYIRYICYIFILCVGISKPVFASVDSTGVVQVILVYEPRDEEAVPVQSGSGFLIGDDSQEASYLVTLNSLVNLTAENKRKIINRYNLNDNESIKTAIQIVVNKDVTLQAQMITSSTEMDMAILKLSSPIYDRRKFVINDLPYDEFMRQDVILLGYPVALGMGSKTKYFGISDIEKYEGSLEKVTDIEGIKYIQHHLYGCEGCLGGPIVNGDDVVLAINTSLNDGQNLYALNSQDIASVCKSLGISIRTLSMIREEQMEIENATKKAMFKRYITIGVISGVVLLIIVILVLTSKKRKQKRLDKKAKMTVNTKAPDFGNSSAPAEIPYKELLSVGNQRVDTDNIIQNNMMNLNDGQTVVFCESENSTHKEYVYLIYRGQNVQLQNIPFVIGKDEKRVNFCISNNAVSRQHAVIDKVNESYVIIDNRSTNGTFINGRRIRPQEQSTLADGDVIKLADEDITFRCERK